MKALSFILLAHRPASSASRDEIAIEKGWNRYRKKLPH
jgi:hypothetical protein